MQSDDSQLSAKEALDVILDMASDVLGRQVAAGDNFFSIGGDSLSAVRLLMRIENFIGEEINPETLVDCDSFAEFIYGLNLSPTTQIGNSPESS